MTTTHIEPSYGAPTPVVASDASAFFAQAINPDETLHLNEEEDEFEEEGEFEEDDELDEEFDDEDEDWEDELDEEFDDEDEDD